MSSFCIGSISWCYFVVLLFRWCSPVSADPLFSSDLELANVTPVYREASKGSRDSYRPVAILFSVSRVCERCMYDQV